MKIAIPSYGRPQQLVDKTLAFLNKHNINKQDIYIFVVDEEQGIYTDSIDDDDYNIIVGLHGIAAQRSYINSYFEEDELILSLDDDITDIMFLDRCIGSVDGSGVLEPVEDFMFLLDSMVEMMNSSGLNLCGCYPVQNAYFMRDKITTQLRFCIGQFLLYYNKKFILSSEAEGKEDYENTLLFYNRDGGVLRYSNVCVKSRAYSKGGLGGNKAVRLRKNIYASDYLKRMYPTQVLDKKKLGEVRLV